ncbi:Na+/H+ antiporter subunit E [Acetobacterium sp. K1/6]|jgi:Multisubunit Na+/H+ antiporter, MnhE subunit|uniref:Na+/H+ antiporter subunit E n=1 Tax=Acetobacterium sp. K1/6 TaxID=3055467 RepID=UPI002ACA50C8|nr:Na+/H+ antiporter subunit E [Acetobacterium sp. K1/6]MDZ5726315.1 Na+/H+ antiporter subunit E [Acetobacterium sp. K1/6]
MKKLRHFIILIFIFTGIWLIFNESLAFPQILIGLFFSIVSVLFTNRYLLENDYIEAYSIKPAVLFHYTTYLFIQIYRSGFSAILKIIRGQDAVKIIEYETCIRDDLAICLLANAITLTPGTVTIGKNGRLLQILAFQDENTFTDITEGKTCSPYEMILRSLES